MADNDPQTLDNDEHSAEAVAVGSVDVEARIEDIIVEAMDAGETERVRDIVRELHYADVADLLERLSREDRARAVEIIRDIFDPEVLSELDETVREDVVNALGVKEVANALSELDSDDAVFVLEEMDEAQQQLYLEHVNDEDRSLIEQGLSYPEDSAGRLMQREVVTVPSQWNVGQCIDYVRRRADSEDDELPRVFTTFLPSTGMIIRSARFRFQNC